MVVAHRTALVATVLAAGLATGLAACNRASKPAPSAAKPTGVVVRTGAQGKQGSSATDNRLGFPELDASWRDSGYRLDWVGYPFVSNSRPGGLRQLAMFDDVVVAQDNTSTVSLLDARTGQTKWSVDLGTPLTRFLAITRDPVDPTRVVVSGESGATIMAVSSGNILGQEKFARVISTAPVAEEGIYVYGTAVGEIIGHRIGLGLKGWGFQGQGPIRANPVRVAGVVGTVSQGGDVTFTDARTGSLMGRARIFGGVENQPVASGDSLIIAGLDQSVWCFGTNGQERWRVRTPHKLTNQPTAINGVVYLDIPGDGMTAMDATNGTTLWKNARVHGRAVVQRAGTVLIFTKEMVHVVDAKRGDVIRSIPAPGIVRLEADKLEDGTLYAVSDRNVVAKMVVK